MDLQTRKLELIKTFLNLQNEDIISRIENLLKKEKNNSKKENLKSFTVDELNARIDQSLIDSEKDNVIEVNDLMEEIKEWN